MRWENPVLGFNVEGRVSPIIPGCQQITAVVAPDGEVLINNKIWRTAPGVENGGDKGQRGTDMSPEAPHTTARQARECTSCHATAKTLGYGTHNGRYMRGYTQGIKVDITGRFPCRCPGRWATTWSVWGYAFPATRIYRPAGLSAGRFERWAMYLD